MKCACAAVLNSSHKEWICFHEMDHQGISAFKEIGPLILNLKCSLNQKLIEVHLSQHLARNRVFIWKSLNTIYLLHAQISKVGCTMAQSSIVVSQLQGSHFNLVLTGFLQKKHAGRCFGNSELPLGLNVCSIHPSELSHTASCPLFQG